MKIEGKLALVTGASSGIGAATAMALAAEGARVALLARREEALRKVTDQIAANGGQARFYPVDLTNMQAVADVNRRIRADLGVPDIIVNNAGAGRWRFIEETSFTEAVQMMALPYFAAFFVTRAFIPDMIARGSGHIVNVNSPACRIPWPGAASYTAARWAQRGLAEALRADLHRTGVRVTHVVAGETETPYWQNNPGSRERLPKIARLIPVIKPEKVADAILDGIEGNRREIVVPFMMRLVFWQHALFPRVVEWMMRATGYRRPAPPKGGRKGGGEAQAGGAGADTAKSARAP